MSDLVPNIFALNAGLDLASPKMLAAPGSLVDCLNYELVDQQGYRRIDGFTRYDGNPTTRDFPDMRVLTGTVLTTAGTPPFSLTNTIFQDEDGNDIGFIFSSSRILPGTTSTIVYLMFEGTATLYGSVGSWSFKGNPGSHTESAITQAQFSALQSQLRTQTVAPRATAVGLHWFRNSLFGIIPQLMLPYAASVNNQVVSYTIGGTLTTTYSAGTATLRDKIVTQEATASLPEEGYFIVSNLNTGSLEANSSATYNFGGAVSVGSGAVYHQAGNLDDTTSLACSIWEAVRPGFFNEDKTPVTPGWTEQPLSYTTTISLTGVLADELLALRKGASASDATYGFDDGGTVHPVVLLDYFIVSGGLDTGDAVIKVQFEYPGVDIDDTYTFNTGPGLATAIADVDTHMSLNYLPGFPQLLEASSRYQHISSNFYATDGFDAVYGVNGASRAYVFDSDDRAFSFIYTQADETLDNPRHIENHAEHLVLGFKSGSVQLSVVGQPTNFSGLDGASEFGVSSRLTGLYALNGDTLAIFCTDRIKSIVGNTVEQFSLRTLVPKTGCIEYTLANCGSPIYLDNRGICTLDASDKYGDFANGRLTSRVFAAIRRKLRRGVVGFSNRAGVACAIPCREKNQYRLYFNDGEILTMTLREEGGPGFTKQKLFLEQPTITDENYVLVPFAWTSEVDDDGVERMFVSHYNQDSPITSKQVFALDSGDSFDGKYIPHSFTINWYFGEAPQVYATLQGLRLHGLSRGLANLKVQAAGAQNDFYFSGASLSTSTTPINLPRNAAAGIVAEPRETTNRCDIAARGLAIQLKFSGSNTDLTLIEPSHVAQVLITYSTPDGAFDL